MDIQQSYSNKQFIRANVFNSVVSVCTLGVRHAVSRVATSDHYLYFSAACIACLVKTYLSPYIASLNSLFPLLGDVMGMVCLLCVPTLAYFVNLVKSPLEFSLVVLAIVFISTKVFPPDYTYPDGTTYSGKWKNGQPHGRGILTLNNGETYSGEWKEGEKHGRGKHTFPDGEYYDGEWKEGKHHGQGTYKALDGMYVGQFENNELNGDGVETLSVNKLLIEVEYSDREKKQVFVAKREGQWKNGEFISGKWTTIEGKEIETPGEHYPDRPEYINLILNSQT